MVHLLGSSLLKQGDTFLGFIWASLGFWNLHQYYSTVRPRFLAFKIIRRPLINIYIYIAQT
jgi:hypothetical protein